MHIISQSYLQKSTQKYFKDLNSHNLGKFLANKINIFHSTETKRSLLIYQCQVQYKHIFILLGYVLPKLMQVTDQKS